jgi:hypothetical protein
MSDIDQALSRRDFVKAVGASALVIPAIGAASATPIDVPGPTPKSPAETAVGRFFESLKPEQRAEICFPFDHSLRRKVGNNWAIVKPTIGDLSMEQQALCREIVQNLTTEEGFGRYMKHMEDDYGGFDAYHVAVFGEPGTEKPFEWVLTGRHETMRADGNSIDGVAFGGPIFYGHDVTGTGTDDPRHMGNVWWYQGEQANKLFASFDDPQKTRALVQAVPADEPKSIKLRGDVADSPGMPIRDLDSQQKEIVRKLIENLLSPFRKVDVDEVQACLAGAGGLDKLRITFYKEGDLGDDGVWDNWKLEGPAFAWFFRSSPHSHVWLNVAEAPAKDVLS